VIIPICKARDSPKRKERKEKKRKEMEKNSEYQYMEDFMIQVMLIL
jgi:hypothetical protein